MRDYLTENWGPIGFLLVIVAVFIYIGAMVSVDNHAWGQEVDACSGGKRTACIAAILDQSSQQSYESLCRAARLRDAYKMACGQELAIPFAPIP